MVDYQLLYVAIHIFINYLFTHYKHHLFTAVNNNYNNRELKSRL